MILRPAQASDLPALVRLHAAAFDAAWSEADLRGLLEAEGGFGVVAEDGDRALGFILCRAAAGEAEVLTLAVDPAARRRGCGRALVEDGAAGARTRGALSLFLEVAADNPGALGLYEAAGFARVGLRRGYYPRPGGPAADALVLARALPPA